ncbi:MAG: peptidoglycan bridge formation glycyltransferase FemA/FemB family protein [Herpetosiphonaceae bacterium]|nr:peptidoglycan bridge formation glycyltransferase FemA/FemB family protein [Herpetosiphonaceae bacterium]
MVATELGFAVREYSDPGEWNALLLDHPRNHILQSWGWGELKGSVGWEPVRVAVLRRDGQFAAAQLLFKRMAGLAVAYVPRGPLWSGDLELDRSLVQFLRTIAHRRRAAFLRLEPNILEHDALAGMLHSLLQVTGFEVAAPLQPRTSIHLDLASPSEKLLLGASKGHRADVRRAERNGVTVRVGSTATDLAAFYAIMQATAARGQFGIHSAEYYARAFHELSAPAYDTPGHDGGAAHVLLAELGGAVVAAFMIFGWGTEGQYMYSGSNELGLKSGANHLLQWSSIRWVQAQGCRCYDLWGVPELAADLEAAMGDERVALEAAAQAHPLYGAYRFKKGWGGQVVRYLPAYDQVYIRPAYWWWKRRRAAA